jgi:uncharacterized protein YdhG (YjbR/CyaY superfamily)
MSAKEIDEYLANLDEPRRSALERLRQTIASIIPEAEQGLSYGVPVFRISERPIAGFSAAKNHLSYLPHSGNILARLTEQDLQGFTATKGAVKIPIDTPFPTDLVSRLINERRNEAGV